LVCDNGPATPPVPRSNRGGSPITRTIISLSTIPPRFYLVGKALQRLLDQSVAPDRIELWIPRFYRRFPDVAFCLPPVPDGVTIEVTDNDLGPATKVLPCARKHRGTDARIVYCDDDRHYGRDWLKTLLAAAAEHPKAAIAAWGMDLPGPTKRQWIRRDIGPDAPRPRVKRDPKLRRGGLQNLHRNLPYWVWREGVRALLKLKIWDEPPRKKLVAGGYADIAEGCGGVLVRPDFFDDAVFEIPPILWSVDDYWLSGHLARRGIPIWVEERVGLPQDDSRLCPDNHVFPLMQEHIDGHTRLEANAAAVQHFRDQYGVWR